MSNHDPKELLNSIESELRQLGLLVGPIQAPEIVHSAFGMAEMPFEHWLARVFLPRAYQAIEANQLPAESHVGAAALRNLDGRTEYDSLVALLCEFDHSVQTRSRSARL